MGSIPDRMGIMFCNIGSAITLDLLLNVTLSLIRGTCQEALHWKSMIE